MTRLPTSSPLVEKDDDNSFIPAGRQHGPERTDGRTTAGLTSAENVAFAFACAHLDNLYPTAEFIYSAEEDAAMTAAGEDSHATAEAKRQFLELYRASHPLPTYYSALPPGDPSLYVPPTIASAPIVLTPIPPVAAAPIAAPASMTAFGTTTAPYIPSAVAPTPPPVAPPVTIAPIVLPQISSPPDTHAAVLASVAGTLLSVAVAMAQAAPPTQPTSVQAQATDAILTSLEPHVNPTGQGIIELLKFAFSHIHWGKAA